MTSTRIRLLDCTLRDGSYQVEFGFTAEETHAIVLALDSAGVDMIEIGHGLGLGAHQGGGPKAAECDVDYMRAARMAARRAKVGVFAMTAFACRDDLTAAREAGMDFVRFGVDAAQLEAAEPFVRHACALGLETTLFLMKSYTLPARTLRSFAPRIADWGAGGAAIVDSAGGMTPNEVREHVRALAETTQLEVAFHGHNNFQLAVGNAFAAVEAGARVIDASLKGMGRSSGNAQIEVLAAALIRAGYAVQADPLALAQAADTFITPEAFAAGTSKTDLVQAMGLVHSGMQPRIDAAAREFGLDPVQLTLSAGAERGGLDLDEQSVRDLAARMRAENKAASAG